MRKPELEKGEGKTAIEQDKPRECEVVGERRGEKRQKTRRDIGTRAERRWAQREEKPKTMGERRRREEFR